ncbi:hypothetical protein SBRCBS47491_004412 [Sporothrix bragantina]|uniref:Major facilitator superfamily (MFS) profile domain-containing protein n=1 Tax=Sporothrix bragantina TaxID=671064 RepID=A0ABP0BN79_9PEZI
MATPTKEITPVHVEMQPAPMSMPGDDQPPTKAEPVVTSAFAHLPWQTLVRLFWRNILLALGAFTGAMFDGYGITMPKSIAANASFIAYFGTTKTATGAVALNPQFVAGWNGIQAGMIIVGLVTAGFVSDRFGRKTNMYLMSALFTIAIVVGMTARHWWVFLIARAFNGVAAGFAQATLTCYVAEIAPVGLRGNLLTGYSFFIALGQLAGNVGLYIIQKHKLNWRNALYSELVFLGLFLPAVVLAPESPYYYANRGDHANAKRMLQRIHGRVPGYDVEREYAVMAAEVAHNARIAQQSAALSWTAVLRDPVHLRRTWISILPLTTQQWSGLPLVLNYLSYFFSTAGVANPFMTTVAQSVILLAMVVVAALFLDRIGRRRLLLVSESVCFVTLIFMGMIGTLAYRNNNNVLTPRMADAITALACIWVAAYALGPAALGYVMVADTATAVLRQKTTGIASAVNSAFGLILTYCTPLMLSAPANWGIRTAYFYGPLCLIGVALIWLTVPETRGRTNAEMDELFERRVPTRQFAKAKTGTEYYVEMANNSTVTAV